MSFLKPNSTRDLTVEKLVHVLMVYDGFVFNVGHFSVPKTGEFEPGFTSPFERVLLIIFNIINNIF